MSPCAAASITVFVVAPFAMASLLTLKHADHALADTRNEHTAHCANQRCQKAAYVAWSPCVSCGVRLRPILTARQILPARFVIFYLERSAVCESTWVSLKHSNGLSVRLRILVIA